MRRLAAFAAFVALLAGCGGSSPSPSASPAPSASVTTSAAPSTTASSPPAALRQGAPTLQKVAQFQGAAYVTSPPGDPRLFVVELPGRIKVVREGQVLPRPFLDIVDLVSLGGERGLLSVAFAPDYATSKRFYVDYTDTNGDVRVVEYRASSSDPDVADESTRRELLKIAKPYANHNGGLVLFDRTGKLLIGTGDGGSAGDPNNRAQNLGDLLGKVLRIDPLPSGGRPYGIPADNPYVHRAGARPEVWMYGLRNPWRFSIDPETGDFYLGDVGQSTWEEIDVIPPAKQPGANLEWRAYEGRSSYTGQPITGPGARISPVHVYKHASGRCAVSGGVVYHGSVAALRGRYLFGDYCTGELWSMPAGTASPARVTALPFKGGHTSSFGVDAAGEVYVVSQDGEVWRIWS
jgi:glucose/arabinose dehydrogenase